MSGSPLAVPAVPLGRPRRGVEWFLTFFMLPLQFFSYLCSHVMTAFNPNMTIHKLFLNIKKRDVYDFHC